MNENLKNQINTLTTKNLELHLEAEDLRKDNEEMLKALIVYRDYFKKRAEK